jgi:cysteine desulfurase
MSDPIYLDHNATTPVLPEVVDAMLPYLRQHFGNPSSGHTYGRHARQGVERAREQVGALLNCNTDEIVFTSGGTEANNWAIRGTAEAAEGPRTIVTSTIEHPATANTCAWLERRGWRIVRLPVNDRGQVLIPEQHPRTWGDAALCTIMHSNNETGVLQPISQLARSARTVSALVHTDAAQSAGKVSLDVSQLDVDFLSLAGHKLYAPKGVGALFVRRGIKIPPLMLGAGHERGLRAGTENVASIVGLGTACEIARLDLQSTSGRITGLRDRLWGHLQALVPEVRMTGHEAQRLPNTLNVRFPYVSGTALLAVTPQVCASTGSACHDGQKTASSVLLAMGLSDADAVGAVRLTLGRSTTEADIDRAAQVLADSWSTLRSNSESGARDLRAMGH